MSNHSPENPSPANPSLPARKRSTALTVLIIIAGVILLLPGLCTAIVGIMLVGDEGWRVFRDIEVWYVAIPCFAISALGLWLLVLAIRNR